MRLRMLRFTLLWVAPVDEVETLVRRQPEGSKMNLLPLTKSVLPDKVRCKVLGLSDLATLAEELASSLVILFFDIFLYITPCMLTMLRDLLTPSFSACGLEL